MQRMEVGPCSSQKWAREIYAPVSVTVASLPSNHGMSERFRAQRCMCGVDWTRGSSATVVSGEARLGRRHRVSNARRTTYYEIHCSSPCILRRRAHRQRYTPRRKSCLKAARQSAVGVLCR